MHGVKSGTDVYVIYDHEKHIQHISLRIHVFNFFMFQEILNHHYTMAEFTFRVGFDPRQVQVSMDTQEIICILVKGDGILKEL